MGLRHRDIFHKEEKLFENHPFIEERAPCKDDIKWNDYYFKYMDKWVDKKNEEIYTFYKYDGGKNAIWVKEDRSFYSKCTQCRFRSIGSSRFEYLKIWISTLSERDQRILHAWVRKKNPTEVSEEFDVTRDRISQILNMIIRKFKRFLRCFFDIDLVGRSEAKEIFHCFFERERDKE